MPRKTTLLALVGCLVIMAALGSGSSADPLSLKTRVGNLTFSGPVSEADQQYLGLSQGGNFTLQDIQAPYVLIEIMRTTCPHCMEQAPAMNRLYRLVTNSDLGGKVRFIGVGESDRAPALQQFKADFKVPFPLVPDPDWDIGTLFNIQGTPTTVLLDKSGRVLLLEDGAFANAAQIFHRIKMKLK